MYVCFASITTLFTNKYELASMIKNIVVTSKSADFFFPNPFADRP